MADSAVMKFFDDVKEGGLEEFDVTTTTGFLKELLVRIKKVDVTGLGFATRLLFPFVFVSTINLYNYIVTFFKF